MLGCSLGVVWTVRWVVVIGFYLLMIRASWQYVRRKRECGDRMCVSADLIRRYTYLLTYLCLWHETFVNLDGLQRCVVVDNVLLVDLLCPRSLRYLCVSHYFQTLYYVRSASRLCICQRASVAGIDLRFLNCSLHLFSGCLPSFEQVAGYIFIYQLYDFILSRITTPLKTSTFISFATTYDCKFIFIYWSVICAAHSIDLFGLVEMLQSFFCFLSLLVPRIPRKLRPFLTCCCRSAKWKQSKKCQEKMQFKARHPIKFHINDSTAAFNEIMQDHRRCWCCCWCCAGIFYGR